MARKNDLFAFPRESLRNIVIFTLHLPPLVRVLISIFASIMIFVLDATTSASVSFFYLPPILLLTWTSGVLPGLTLSIISAFVERHVLASQGSSEIELLWNTAIRICTFGTMIALVTLLRDHLDAVSHLASRDHLTGLLNAGAFRIQAQVALERARRSGLPVTIAFFDCDNFKKLNDTEGHVRGDQFLQAVGKVFETRLRKGDISGRVGGDEFALLLPGTNENQARALLDHLTTTLMHKAATGTPVTFSVGALAYSKPPAEVEDLIEAADNVMYEVKKGTKAAIILRSS